MKLILCIVLLGANLAVSAQTNLSLSYDDALQMLQKGNQSLKIADKGIEAARTERDKLNALWYPSLQGAGTYVHMSEKIEVKQPLSLSLIHISTMALSGVRTSWLILERNIFFFFIARSAFCIIHSCERFDSFKRNMFFQLK